MADDVNATPDIPDIQATQSATSGQAIKIATPDIILFNEDAIPVEVMADLLFEEIGGQEIISIARNDIVNGQNVSYSLIGNLNGLQRRYNSKNIFSLPDTIEKYFSNFSIRFDTHVPEKGTGPLRYYVGERQSRESEGCLNYPIIDSKTDDLVECWANRNAALERLEEINPERPRVYFDQQTRDLIIDVINMEVNERVDVEVLRSGTPLSDTIYEEES